ncbi:MAG: DUF2804 domain-containing protein [Spirochaetaceae bacterium]|jgi:hypothetical protein|nr:DUF2804 domain-containing protein [Spirochaetaceae bacterium]
MYTRDIQPPVPYPVISGKPVQGTWTRPFERVNLMDIAHPFSFPLPKWAINFRIKEWQSFTVQNDEIFFDTLIANLKFFRFLEAVFLNKTTGETKYYFDYFPVAFWQLPDSLGDSFLEYKTLGYSLSVHNWLNESTIAFSFDINPLDDLTVMDAQFEINLDTRKRPPLVTNLLFTEDRSVYSYKNLGGARGTIVIGETEYTFAPESTLAFVRDCKGFFPYIARSDMVTGFGFDNDGTIIGFSLTENHARGAQKNNENALWVNGMLTPLPPVKITHALGHEKTWVIEDIEGMVDLSFTPQKQIKKKGFDIILSKADFYKPVGIFNGMLKTKNDEKIILRNLSGYAESIYLRL